MSDFPETTPYDGPAATDRKPAHRDGTVVALPARGFAEFGLPAAVLRSIAELGYREPTDIQRASIPALLTGRDVTGVAQTGTGKTAAYGLPLLAAIQPGDPTVQALVLVPTRELAIQVTDALRSFAAQVAHLDVVAIYGGAPIHRQIAALKHGAQVVVGTPGRVIDLIERKSLRLDAVSFAVLDEADEMLRMGFAEDVDRILTSVPTDRQTALFSATMPKEIRRVAATHLRHPIDVSVADSATPVSAIEQQYVVLPFRDKAVALQRIIATTDAEAAVVFVRTRQACDDLGSELIASGVKAAFISGDVSQNERERTVDRLRSGQLDVLVATDVAARGMDVERIGLVVNFDAPADPETYIHRVGRTGRAGRSGLAVTFFTPKETSRLRYIEKTIGRPLVEIAVPTAADVHAHQAKAALGAAVERQAAGRLDNYRRALAAAAARSGVDAVDLAAALLASLVGDDGSAPIEIATHPRRRSDGPREGQQRRDGQSYGDARPRRRDDRPARSFRDDRGDRAAKGDRPFRGDRTFRDDRGGRSDRAPRNDRPVREGRAARDDRAARSSSWTDKGAARPARNKRDGYGAQNRGARTYR